MKGKKTFRIRRIKLDRAQRLNVTTLNQLNMKYANHYRYGDHDPILDRVMMVADESGLTANEISKHCGLAASTVLNWLSKKTKNPQNKSTDAFFRAYGFYRPLVRIPDGEK